MLGRRKIEHWQSTVWEAKEKALDRKFAGGAFPDGYGCRLGQPAVGGCGVSAKKLGVQESILMVKKKRGGNHSLEARSYLYVSGHHLRLIIRLPCRGEVSSGETEKSSAKGFQHSVGLGGGKILPGDEGGDHPATGWGHAVRYKGLSIVGGGARL